MNELQVEYKTELPKLLTTKELESYLHVSRNTARKIGKECGAVRHAGRRILFDLDTINAAIKT